MLLLDPVSTSADAGPDLCTLRLYGVSLLSTGATVPLAQVVAIYIYIYIYMFIIGFAGANSYWSIIPILISHPEWLQCFQVECTPPPVQAISLRHVLLPFPHV